METLEADGWAVRHDRAATTAYYRTLARSGVDDCGCSYCRNFALQRSTAFPAEFLRLPERLGIDVGKEHEVHEMGPIGDGRRLYGGWFCFIGELAKTPAALDAALDASRFSFVFTNSFPWPAGVPRSAAAAVEFLTLLPWVLADERPD